jgi:hypothetical protein
MNPSGFILYTTSTWWKWALPEPLVGLLFRVVPSENSGDPFRDSKSFLDGLWDARDGDLRIRSAPSMLRGSSTPIQSSMKERLQLESSQRKSLPFFPKQRVSYREPIKGNSLSLRLFLWYDPSTHCYWKKGLRIRYR